MAAILAFEFTAEKNHSYIKLSCTVSIGLGLTEKHQFPVPVLETTDVETIPSTCLGDQ